MINLLETIRKLQAKPKLEPVALKFDDREVTLSFRRNARCKRMVLRLTPDGSNVVLTLPTKVSVASAIRFAETSKPWILKTMAERSPAVTFSNENQILFQGKLHTIITPGGRRGLVSHSVENLTLEVPGDAAHVPRRLTDWLKAQAKEKLHLASQNYAIKMDAKFQSLSVRDQKSRWGSCSATGDLSFSWRLILAPPEILEYVAAHEVAHLKEMNHGPKFWRLVATHCNCVTNARRWLRDHGRELHRFGAK